MEKIANEAAGKLKMGSFFAGVGGIDLGFEMAGPFERAYANEFDPYPARIGDLNSSVKTDVRDVRTVEPDQIPDFDVCLAGFPCQAFSIAGLRQGFADVKGRGELFFEVARIVEAKRPKVVFLENVKNLVGHDGGNTFRVIRETMEALGYHLKWKVMNAADHGVPQGRERIYVVCFLDPEACDRFEFPEAFPLPAGALEKVVDFHSKVDDRYFYAPGKHKGGVYEALDAAMDDPRSVYQWRRTYVRKNMSGVVPTLTANMGGGGHNVPIVRTDHGIRKLTPRECFNAQGFPADFRLPDDMAESRLYKAAGNSVCVGVIRQIAENVAKALGL